MCRSWRRTKECPRLLDKRHCSFEHPADWTPERKPCFMFREQGRCTRGASCQFSSKTASWTRLRASARQPFQADFSRCSAPPLDPTSPLGSTQQQLSNEAPHGCVRALEGPFWHVTCTVSGPPLCTRRVHHRRVSIPSAPLHRVPRPRHAPADHRSGAPPLRNSAHSAARRGAPRPPHCPRAASVPPPRLVSARRGSSLRVPHPRYHPDTRSHRRRAPHIGQRHDGPGSGAQSGAVGAGGAAGR